MLIVNVSSGVASPPITVLVLKVIDPVPVSRIRSSVPPAPLIVELKVISPSCPAD